MVGSVLAFEQKLGGFAGKQRSIDLHSHEPFHAVQAFVGMKVSATINCGWYVGKERAKAVAMRTVTPWRYMGELEGMHFG